MGVARHQHILVAFALVDEGIEERGHRTGDILDALAGKQFEVYEHLVVARTA